MAEMFAALGLELEGHQCSMLQRGWKVDTTGQREESGMIKCSAAHFS